MMSKEELIDIIINLIDKFIDERESRTCANCLYRDKQSWEKPCAICIRNCNDYYKFDYRRNEECI